MDDGAAVLAVPAAEQVGQSMVHDEAERSCPASPMCGCLLPGEVVQRYEELLCELSDEVERDTGKVGGLE